MSAIAEDPVNGADEGPVPVVQVLIALHPNFSAQDLVGPLEVLSRALQKSSDASKFFPEQQTEW